MTQDIIESGIVAIAEGVKAGDITSEQVTQIAIKRLNGRGRSLNGVILIDADRALEQARAVDLKRTRGERLGILAGVPLAHKDLFYRAGRVASCGSKIRRAFVPAITATVLDRLDEEDAVDCGTLHMTEFAVGPTGYNEHFGHGRNPWNPDHVCGGSSSGSGIVVSSSCVPGALGSDTGGSIRHPSAMCGLTGLKPTHGAVSRYGVMPLSGTLDCVGPIARHARDTARLFDIISGRDILDSSTSNAHVEKTEERLTGDIRGVSIGCPRNFYHDLLEPDVAMAFAEAVKTFGSLGVRVRDSDVPDMERLNALSSFILAVEGATLHRTWLEERPNDYADQVRARLEPGLLYPATRYVEAISLKEPLTREWIDRAIGSNDCAVVPILSTSVPSIAETTKGSQDEITRIIGGVTRNTRAINYLGLPSVAVPCGFSANGLPIAVQIVGRPWAEALLLKIADAFQRVTDWHLRTPTGLATMDSSLVSPTTI
jgi:aspartyl-tRNA(Asn)/glutamyl-tRNA(Gln) amidotransferase subunit A